MSVNIKNEDVRYRSYLLADRVQEAVPPTAPAGAADQPSTILDDVTLGVPRQHIHFLAGFPGYIEHLLPLFHLNRFSSLLHILTSVPKSS